MQKSTSTVVPSGDATVTNYGRITGAYDGSGTGDGDGVDIRFFQQIAWEHRLFVYDAGAGR